MNGEPTGRVRKALLTEKDGSQREIEVVSARSSSALETVRQRVRTDLDAAAKAEADALRDLLPWVAKWPLRVQISRPAAIEAQKSADDSRSVTLGDLQRRMSFISEEEGKTPLGAPEEESVAVYCGDSSRHDAGTGATVVDRLPFIRTTGARNSPTVVFIGAPNEWWLGGSLAPWLGFATEFARAGCIQAEMLTPGIFRNGEREDRPEGYTLHDFPLARMSPSYEDWDWLTWNPEAGGRPKFTFKCWDCGEPSRASGKPEDMALIVEGLVKAGRTSVSLKELKRLFTEAGRRRNRR